IPSGLIAERLGTAPVLALGTALVGTGYCLAGASAGFGLLVVALFVGGLGASAQHPLASSLMARAFAGPRSMKALGSSNFAGDIGKMTLPAAASLLLVAMSWRPALALLGGLGLLAAAAIFVLTPRYGAEIPSQVAHQRGADGALGARHRFAFPLLLSIGMLDSATRMGLLLFLPFVLPANGASLPTGGLGLTVVFRRRRGGQAHLRLRRRAHRSRRHRVAHRRTNRGRDRGAAAAGAGTRIGAAAGHRHRAQRHVVGALRLGS